MDSRIWLSVFSTMDDWTSDTASRTGETAMLFRLDECGVSGGERWTEFVAEGVPVMVVPVAIVGVGILMGETAGRFFRWGLMTAYMFCCA